MKIKFFSTQKKNDTMPSRSVGAIVDKILGRAGPGPKPAPLQEGFSDGVVSICQTTMDGKWSSSFDVTVTIDDEMVADLEPTPYDHIDEIGEAATITKRVRAGPPERRHRTNWNFTQNRAIKERKACERRRGRARDLALRQKSSLHRPEWVGDNYYGSYIGYKGRVEEERGPGWQPIYDLTLEGLELVGYRKVQIDLPSDREWSNNDSSWC